MFTIREKKPMLNPAIVSEQMQVKLLFSLFREKLYSKLSFGEINHWFYGWKSSLAAMPQQFATIETTIYLPK